MSRTRLSSVTPGLATAAARSRKGISGEACEADAHAKTEAEQNFRRSSLWLGKATANPHSRPKACAFYQAQPFLKIGCEAESAWLSLYILQEMKEAQQAVRRWARAAETLGCWRRPPPLLQPLSLLHASLGEGRQ